MRIRKRVKIDSQKCVFHVHDPIPIPMTLIVSLHYVNGDNAAVVAAAVDYASIKVPKANGIFGNNECEWAEAENGL